MTLVISRSRAVSRCKIIQNKFTSNLIVQSYKKKSDYEKLCIYAA